MAEEKREDELSPKPAEAAQEKVETKAETTQAPSAPAAAEKVEEKKKDLRAKSEKPSNCAACNKSLKRKRWYYRNGKYYCTKRCWKTILKKEEKPSAAKK